MSERGGPDWVRDGIRQFVDEVRLFLRTAVDFTLRPTRFAKQWSTGERHALNPLGFLATAFAVIAPCEAVMAHVVHHDGRGDSLWSAALGAVLPFGYYLLVGAIEHGVLFAFGTRRPLRDSCAMALYAGGGPATAARLVMGACAVFAYLRSGQTEVRHVDSLSAGLLLAGALLSFSLFYFTLSAALGGVHDAYRIRWWHILIANLVAMLVCGLGFGWLHPPGSYGLHMVIGVAGGGRDWSFGISD